MIKLINYGLLFIFISTSTLLLGQSKKPLDSIIKEFNIDKGLFTTYIKGDELYFELNDSLLGKEIKKILINLRDNYIKSGIEEPKIANVLRDNDLRILDKDPNTSITGGDGLYTRFGLLNNYLESLGLLLAWSWIISKYSIENFVKIQNIESAAAGLHKINISKLSLIHI